MMPFVNPNDVIILTVEADGRISSIHQVQSERVDDIPFGRAGTTRFQVNEMPDARTTHVDIAALKKRPDNDYSVKFKPPELPPNVSASKPEVPTPRKPKGGSHD